MGASAIEGGPEATMRSSFYSSYFESLSDMGDKEEELVRKLTFSNILELSSRDLKVVNEFKNFMAQQVKEL